MHRLIYCMLKESLSIYRGANFWASLYTIVVSLFHMFKSMFISEGINHDFFTIFTLWTIFHYQTFYCFNQEGNPILCPRPTTHVARYLLTSASSTTPSVYPHYVKTWSIHKTRTTVIKKNQATATFNNYRKFCEVWTTDMPFLTHMSGQTSNETSRQTYKHNDHPYQRWSNKNLFLYHVIPTRWLLIF